MTRITPPDTELRDRIFDILNWGKQNSFDPVDLILDLIHQERKRYALEMIESESFYELVFKFCKSSRDDGYAKAKSEIRQWIEREGE